MVGGVSSIDDAEKGESARGEDDWQMGNRFGPVIKEGDGVLGGAVVASDFEEEAADPAHHSSDEGGAGDVDPDFVSDLSDMDLPEVSDGVALGRCELAEGEEVVFTLEVSGGFLHGFEVERSSVIVGEPGPVGVFVSGEDAVSVVSELGGETAVEVWFDEGRRDDADIRGEDPVECAGPFFDGDGGGGVEVAGLSERVGSAVGAAGSYEFGFGSLNLCYSLCQCAVDSSLSILRRPAAEVSPVVCDDEFDPLGLRSLVLFSRQVR